eukprot:s6164_g3.t1
MYGSSAAAQQSVERWNRSAPEEAAGAAKGSRRVKWVSSIIARTGAGDGERSRSGDPAAVKVLSDCSLLRSPNTGYHFNVFHVKTLSQHNLTIASGMTSYATDPCGAWDLPIGKVLPRARFHPFRWPSMPENSLRHQDQELMNTCSCTWSMLAAICGAGAHYIPALPLRDPASWSTGNPFLAISDRLSCL